MENKNYYPLIVVYGEPVSSRYLIVQASSLLDDPTDFSQEAAAKAMEKVNSLLEKGGLVVVLKTYKGHIGNELIKKAHVSTCVENSAHSFTEGADFGRTNSADELLRQEQNHTLDDIQKGWCKIQNELDKKQPFTIDEQIKWLDSFIGTSLEATIIGYIKENLQAIQRFNQSTALHNVDVEKVITDLLQIAKEYAPHRGPKTEDHMYQYEIQNAEAALGMLQAFKKERKPTYEVKVKISKETITNELFFDIRAVMPSPNNREIAKAIVEAIDKMLKLKNL